MKRVLRYRDNNTEPLNVWPSFTDLMANAFMIISLFLLLALFKSLFLKYQAEEQELDLTQSERQVRILKRQLALLDNNLQQGLQENQQLKNRLEASLDNITKLEQSSSALQNLLRLSNNQINVLESENKRLKSAPPVVVIQDSGEYKFASGSATLPKELQKYILNDLVERIEAITQQRNLYIVEIIGHTDGQVNFNSSSNLDENLEAVAQGKKSINTLTPGSNADLGLMRALEVVKQLQKAQEAGRLQGVQFRAYSAAQLQLPSGDFAPASRNPNASRRRIEIRFSPLGRAETIR